MTTTPPPAAPFATPQAPPPPDGSTRPQLRRSSTERMLGGVCGGLAEYSGIDVVLWRVGLVALALMGPGVIVYPLLWVLMPSDRAGRPGPLDAVVDRLHDALSGTRGTGTRP